VSETNIAKSKVEANLQQLQFKVNDL
jgi:hypothetical protein